MFPLEHPRNRKLPGDECDSMSRSSRSIPDGNFLSQTRVYFVRQVFFTNCSFGRPSDSCPSRATCRISDCNRGRILLFLID